ncbi:hypothetical protein F9K91_07745 [Brucella tritici]|uniref:Uncharacterized protein n=1 Tax=Brucella tritici TaxID=94626 RepID=A0A833CNQ7_9HYPH|nr:hypothetical protein [Brucella tritici]KAB2666014.1 hypothetical protein F9K91_07745 [Brucella tritici]
MTFGGGSWARMMRARGRMGRRVGAVHVGAGIARHERAGMGRRWHGVGRADAFRLRLRFALLVLLAYVECGYVHHARRPASGPYLIAAGNNGLWAFV